jgi:hypothetical protein
MYELIRPALDCESRSPPTLGLPCSPVPLTADRHWFFAAIVGTVLLAGCGTEAPKRQAQPSAEATRNTPVTFVHVDQRAPVAAGPDRKDRVEVRTKGDLFVVNVYREKGIGGVGLRAPASGWPAVVAVRLHGFPDLESFKASAGGSALVCGLQRPEARAPEQVCRIGDARVEALKRTPEFYQVTLPSSMLTPAVQTAELHWVDQWR